MLVQTLWADVKYSTASMDPREAGLTGSGQSAFLLPRMRPSCSIQQGAAHWRCWFGEWVLKHLAAIGCILL